MAVSPAFSERRRKALHMAMGSWALLLRYLSWRQAAALAATALLFNLFVLPRVAGGVYRPSDLLRGFSPGIVFYALSILLLILLFPSRLDIVAAVWGVLAMGDGAATIVGQRVASPRLPWNRDKSVAGSAAFILVGGTAAVLLALWVRPAVAPPPPLTFAILAPILATIVAAGFETIDVRLDDNLIVPFTAAAVMWGASLATTEAASMWAETAIRAVLIGAVVNVVLAAAAWRARTVSTSGAAAGALVGAAIYAWAGFGAWLLLVAVFGAASITSRLGLQRKSLLGIAEERGGRRGPGNALANCGAACFAAALVAFTPHTELALLALTAALVAGGSDTVASEIGKAFGRRTILVTRLASVRPGTPGAVSVEGTAAGLVSAFMLAMIAAAAGLVAMNVVWMVVAGATVGAFVESALGATLEAPGILNNDLLNFINTTVGAACAVLLRIAL